MAQMAYALFGRASGNEIILKTKENDSLLTDRIFGIFELKVRASYCIVVGNEITKRSRLLYRFVALSPLSFHV